MIEPIKPSEIIDKKQAIIPDEVIDAFNILIVKYWQDNKSAFKQDEVVSLIKTKMDIASDVIFTNHWLDVEDIYRKAGWIVEYDKPYDAIFTFKRKPQ